MDAAGEVEAAGSTADTAMMPTAAGAAGDGFPPLPATLLHAAPDLDFAAALDALQQGDGGDGAATPVRDDIDEAELPPDDDALISDDGGGEAGGAAAHAPPHAVAAVSTASSGATVCSII